MPGEIDEERVRSHFACRANLAENERALSAGRRARRKRRRHVLRLALVHRFVEILAPTDVGL